MSATKNKEPTLDKFGYSSSFHRDFLFNHTMKWEILICNLQFVKFSS